MNTNRAKMSPMEKLMRTWRRTFMAYSIMLSSRDIFRIPMNLLYDNCEISFEPFPSIHASTTDFHFSFPISLT
jgi:hypothetical protein